jgi:hypothetical protein
MTTVEEIERVIEKLPREEFERLAAWMEQRRGASGESESVQQEITDLSVTDPKAGRGPGNRMILRDHSAFLNGYSPADEGLYDDATAR